MQHVGGIFEMLAGVPRPAPFDEDSGREVDDLFYLGISGRAYFHGHV
jgi:hypothetical protein